MPTKVRRLSKLRIVPTAAARWSASEQPVSTLSGRSAHYTAAAGYAPHLPFAISAGIGSIGWTPDIRTRFLRELSDNGARAASSGRAPPLPALFGRRWSGSVRR